MCTLCPFGVGHVQTSIIGASCIASVPLLAATTIDGTRRGRPECGGYWGRFGSWNTTVCQSVGGSESPRYPRTTHRGRPLAVRPTLFVYGHRAIGFHLARQMSDPDRHWPEA